MEIYPDTLLEFQKMFSSEKACRDYLVKIRWDDGFCCPVCSHNKFWEMSSKLYWCKNCNQRTSVTSGTIFHSSHKSLRLWFNAIWYVVNQPDHVNLNDIVMTATAQANSIYVHREE